MKKKFIFTSVFLLTSISLVILLMKIFYPYHRMFAFFIYLITWGIFFYNLYKTDKASRFLAKHKDKLRYFKNNKIKTFNFITLIFFGIILLILFPLTKFDYFDLSPVELKQKLTYDLSSLKIYQEGQGNIIHLFQENTALLERDFDSLTDEEQKFLLSLWSSYLNYAQGLDFLYQTHKYFYQINYFEEPELNSLSFLIAYGSFSSNYKNLLILIDLINGSEFIKTLFNEENLELGISKNAYLNLSRHIISIGNILRLNAGYANLLFLEKFRKNISNEELIAIDYNKKNYLVTKNLIVNSSGLYINLPLENFEKYLFETFFPAQKGIAEGISYISLGLRDEYITEKDLDILYKQLLPGDIFLQRRKWHLTNVGIPGFWTHAAFYIGTSNDLEHYFSDIISVEALRSLIAEANPEFYKDYYADGNLAVIEALRDGVILNSLYKSASADYLAVLRVNLSKKEKLYSILKAISFYGKPYDYNFDFVTDNELVCSELVFKSYRLKDDFKGVPFELELNSGRLMLSPNNIAKQFSWNLGDYLDFVAFLNYDGEKIFFDSEENFKQSWK